MPDTKWTYPDGTSITEHEDGSFTVTEANGAKTHYDDNTGRRTETPAPGAGGQPTVTAPNKTPKTDKGEIEIRYPDGSRVYIRRNPKRFRVVRSLPAVPRKWEVEMDTGTRNVQQEENGDITSTRATTDEPQSLTPSEHPAEGGGSSQKGQPKRKPTKPARKVSKPNKKKSRR